MENTIVNGAIIAVFEIENGMKQEDIKVYENICIEAEIMDENGQFLFDALNDEQKAIVNDWM